MKFYPVKINTTNNSYSPESHLVIVVPNIKSSFDVIPLTQNPELQKIINYIPPSSTNPFHLEKIMSAANQVAGIPRTVTPENNNTSRSTIATNRAEAVAKLKELYAPFLKNDDFKNNYTLINIEKKISYLDEILRSLENYYRTFKTGIITELDKAYDEAYNNAKTSQAKAKALDSLKTVLDTLTASSGGRQTRRNLRKHPLRNRFTRKNFRRIK